MAQENRNEDLGLEENSSLGKKLQVAVQDTVRARRHADLAIRDGIVNLVRSG